VGLDTYNNTANNNLEFSTNHLIQIVCFKLGNEEYAINVLNIKEVINIPPITRISQMPDFVRGVINIRGNIIPVFDMRRKFRLKDNAFTNESRILIVMIGDDMIGLIVDKVLETLRLDDSMIDQVPPVKMAVDRECIIGIGKLTGRLIIVVDVERLHAFIVDDIAQYTSSIKKKGGKI
jgi:purine-binding chemotaxis protein CheW